MGLIGYLLWIARPSIKAVQVYPCTDEEIFGLRLRPIQTNKALKKKRNKSIFPF